MKIVNKIFEIDDYVVIQGWKNFQLNLNYYRTAHYQVLNKAKIKFKQNIFAEYPEIKSMGQAYEVSLEYTVVPHNKRKFDTGNLISIVEKFFLDALVESGIIADDNYTIVKESKTNPVDKINELNKNKKIIIEVKFKFKD
jgi:hypothetical protein